MGVQKGSLYSLTESKQELLAPGMREGAAAFHGALDADAGGRFARGRPHPARAARRTSQSSPASWTPRPSSPASGAILEGAASETSFRAERRRYEERWHELLREGAERGALRADLDVGAAVLLVLSAANWAYTWLAPRRDTDALADRFFGIIADGVRGYATSPG